jgi:hypothetical protein
VCVCVCGRWWGWLERFLRVGANRCAYERSHRPSVPCHHAAATVSRLIPPTPPSIEITRTRTHTHTHTQRQVGVAGAAVSALRAAKGIHDAMPKELEAEDGEDGAAQEGVDAATAATAVAAAAAAGVATAAVDGTPSPPVQASSEPGGPEQQAATKPPKKTREEQQQLREQEAQRAVQEGLPALIQLMWRMSALDVQVGVGMGGLGLGVWGKGGVAGGKVAGVCATRRLAAGVSKSFHPSHPNFHRHTPHSPTTNNPNDHQKTVARASRKTVKDTSAPDDVRRRRAQALVLLGAHFQSVGKRALAAEAAKALEAAGAGGGGSKGEAAARQVEEAIQRAMALHQGQEV